MARWKQTKVYSVSMTLEGMPGALKATSGVVGEFDGTVEGAVATFRPRTDIVKAERALKLLFEAPGPLSRSGAIPEWLRAWMQMRDDASPTDARLHGPPTSSRFTTPLLKQTLRG